jgi:lysyl-tRNA synthetase class 2
MPSTAIRQAVYDAETRVLTLTFVTGRRYRYQAVPLSVAEGSAAARSKGGYFNARIRDRFAFEELEHGDES